RVNLKHAGVNVDSKDAEAWTKAEKKMKKDARYASKKARMEARLKAEISAVLKGGTTDLVVLFHELHPVTYLHLLDFIKAIRDGVTETDHEHTPKFADSRDVAKDILKVVL